MKYRIPIIALALLMTSCLAAEPTTKPAVDRSVAKPATVEGLESEVEFPPAALIGQWQGQASIIVNWCKQRTLPVAITIASDGTVTGTVGDAKLANTVIRKKSVLQTELLKHKTKYIVRGDLTGPIIKSEQITRKLITLTLSDVTDGRITGGLATSGTHVGGKKTMVLTAIKMVLSKPTPAKQPTSGPTTATATTPAPAVDPVVMAILKRLEAAGDKYPNITAKIDYKVDMLQTGDTESRTGKVYYQGPGEKDSAKFRIHFDTLCQGSGPKIKDVVDYAFDGAWLTIRKERIKQMSRYQVARPGEKVNPLQLGKGPFPVPFGQKADAVIKHFRATTRPIKKTDPKDADYIKLTTRRQYRKEFSVVWLEMWISRKTSLPVKIVAEDRSENQTTVIFKDTKTPKSFDKKTFTLPRPPAGWEYHVERYKK